jgi:hypothetical protein
MTEIGTIPAMTDRFANPFIICVDPSCQRRVTNVRYPGAVNVPCGHAGTANVCPSWGPVDGCTCAQPHGPARDPNLNEGPGGWS